MATKPITQPNLVLARIDMARVALAEAKTLQDAKRIADIAEAARVYAKRVKAGTEAVNYAMELRLRAERLLGGMLARTPDSKPGPKQLSSKKEPNSHIPRLSDLGIDKKLSSRAQVLAAIAACRSLAPIVAHLIAGQ
jgi:hypothetical protein